MIPERLLYKEYTGCATLFRAIFSEKNSEKGTSVVQKNSGKGCDVWKKFQIGLIILMTQMTNQKKTELIDDLDLAWTKNPQLSENFQKMETICPKTALKIVFWRPPLDVKISKKVLLFRQNFQKGSM